MQSDPIFPDAPTALAVPNAIFTEGIFPGFKVNVFDKACLYWKNVSPLVIVPAVSVSVKDVRLLNAVELPSDVVVPAGAANKVVDALSLLDWDPSEAKAAVPASLLVV